MTTLLEKLRGLVLPDDTLHTGTVIDTGPAGTVVVRLVNGGYLQPRGEAAIGSKVYVRSGQIIGDAPDLDSYELEV